jgi:hypothetical protein
VIVSHRAQTVEVWTRASETWSLATFRSGQRAATGPLGLHLDVDALCAAAVEPES